MTKEDYLQLSKERLAELLAERDAADALLRSNFQNPMQVGTYTPPCFAGGPCTNPHHDCINCPRQNGYGSSYGGIKFYTKTEAESNE